MCIRDRVQCALQGPAFGSGHRRAGSGGLCGEQSAAAAGLSHLYFLQSLAGVGLFGKVLPAPAVAGGAEENKDERAQRQQQICLLYTSRCV